MDASIDPPINILIVDDEPKNLTVLESVLSDPGYRLIRAESADQALLALVVEEFALLILDIRMPGMTGLELAEMIKERKKTARVPIIFLTAYYNEDQHVLTGYETGAVDYLHKPVNPLILRSKVAVFAELHRKSRELEAANGSLLAEVADRRRAEEQLRELNETLECRVAERTEALRTADRRKDEFLALLAHELRNPLGPIRTGLEALKMAEEWPESLEDIRSTMERQTKQLVVLVDDLLDVSRITTGKLELRKSRVKLADVIQSSLEASRPFIEEAGHRLNVIPVDVSIYLDADANRLAQVFSNLLNNAAKFTPEGGMIDLKIERQGSEVLLSVADNGIGIPHEMLDQIFEMFTQVSLPDGVGSQGLGVGLTLVKSLVEMHGGRVEVYSGGPLKGSEFLVRLPVLIGQQDQGEVLTDSPMDSIPAPRRRVLVVDDNLAGVKLLSMVIKSLGNDVRTAQNGLEAIEVAESFLPEVVLMDLGMPIMNGFEAARHIREKAWGQNMVLVALSGWGQEDDKRKTKEAGFDWHLTKPAEPAELRKLLRTPSRDPNSSARDE